MDWREEACRPNWSRFVWLSIIGEGYVQETKDLRTQCKVIYLGGFWTGFRTPCFSDGFPDNYG